MAIKHSIMGRQMVGKTLGFVIGVIVMLMQPLFNLPIFSMYSFGMVLMFTLMGLTIAFAGTLDRVPVMRVKANWWVYGPFLGAVYMLMFVLLTYSTTALFLKSAILSWAGLSSPFWCLIDGAIIGAIIAFVTKRLAGEGSSLPMS